MEKEVEQSSVSMNEQMLKQLPHAVDERMPSGFMPQCSATTDSNSSTHGSLSSYYHFYILAQIYNAPSEPCFRGGCSFDYSLLTEMGKRIQLALDLDQEYFLHEVMRNNFPLVKEAFMDGTEKVDAIIISHIPTFGQTGEFLSLSEEEQSKHPDMKEFCEPWKGLVRPFGRNGNVILTRCVKDLYFDDGTIMYPKGTLIGTIAKDPFPKISEPYAYRELLDPDNYSAPHDVLDFVNEKLHEAYPQFNLWCVALDLDNLSIFDLDKLPHMKRY